MHWRWKPKVTKATRANRTKLAELTANGLVWMPKALSPLYESQKLEEFQKKSPLSPLITNNFWPKKPVAEIGAVGDFFSLVCSEFTRSTSWYLEIFNQDRMSLSGVAIDILYWLVLNHPFRSKKCGTQKSFRTFPQDVFVHLRDDQIWNPEPVIHLKTMLHFERVNGSTVSNFMTLFYWEEYRGMLHKTSFWWSLK